MPIEILPDYLGGNVKLNHRSWLNECNKLVKNKMSTCSYYYYDSPNENENRKRPLYDMSIIGSKKQIIQNKTFKQETSIETFPSTLSPSPSSMSEDCYQSIQTFDCPNWFTISQLIAHIANNGAYGLSEEFKNIRAQPIISSFDSFK